jgi:hypothetical protein
MTTIYVVTLTIDGEIRGQSAHTTFKAAQAAARKLAAEQELGEPSQDGTYWTDCESIDLQIDAVPLFS